jgi:hypothetical protein
MTGIFGILESSAMQWYQDVAPTQEFCFHRHIYSLWVGQTTPSLCFSSPVCPRPWWHGEPAPEEWLHLATMTMVSTSSHVIDDSPLLHCPWHLRLDCILQKIGFRLKYQCNATDLSTPMLTLNKDVNTSRRSDCRKKKESTYHRHWTNTTPKYISAIFVRKLLIFVPNDQHFGFTPTKHKTHSYFCPTEPCNGARKLSPIRTKRI